MRFLRFSYELLQETRRANPLSWSPLQHGGTCAAHGILQDPPKSLPRCLLGGVLGALGTLLERSWTVLGHIWALFGGLFALLDTPVGGNGRQASAIRFVLGWPGPIFHRWVRRERSRRHRLWILRRIAARIFFTCFLFQRFQT